MRVVRSFSLVLAPSVLLACVVDVRVEPGDGGAAGAASTSQGTGGDIASGGGLPLEGGGGQLASGGGVPWDGSFELFVTSQSDGSVKVYDEMGRHVQSIGGMLGDPLDAALGPDGNILVTDGVAEEIARFTRDGTPLDPLAHLAAPFGMVIVDGTAYVCEQPVGLVRAFDAVSGDDRGTFAASEGEFSMPHDVAIKDGRLYVALWNTGTIEVFDLETRASLGNLFSGDIGAIALDFGPDGDLYVAYLYGGVRRYDATTGELVAQVVSNAEATLGIAFGPDGMLYVANGESGVRRFGLDGTGGDYFVEPMAGGLANPYHIAFIPVSAD